MNDDHPVMTISGFEAGDHDDLDQGGYKIKVNRNPVPAWIEHTVGPDLPFDQSVRSDGPFRVKVWIDQGVTKVRVGVWEDD